MVVEMGASRSPEAELGHEYKERVSVAVFGVGVRSMNASGCGDVQFRVTNLTNCLFISTFACRKLHLASDGHLGGLRCLESAAAFLREYCDHV